MAIVTPEKWYIAFWLAVWGGSFVALYWVVKWAVYAALVGV